MPDPAPGHTIVATCPLGHVTRVYFPDETRASVERFAAFMDGSINPRHRDELKAQLAADSTFILWRCLSGGTCQEWITCTVEDGDTRTP